MLPTRVPNLLVNGSSGIAVGMATNIPPHNLTEIINATIALIQNPHTPFAKILEMVPGPDFPTGGYHPGPAGHLDAFTKGRGQLKLRAKAAIERMGKDREHIIVTEIPYQVNKSRLIEHTAALVNEKKIEGISEIRDESDRDGMRIVFELKRGEQAEVILNNLYKHTQLQIGFGVIMLSHRQRAAARAGPDRLHQVLHRAPRGSGAAAHRIRAAQGARARAHLARIPEGAGQSGRGDPADPRGADPARSARIADRRVPVHRAAGAGHHRAAIAAPHRHGAAEDHRRAGRDSAPHRRIPGIAGLRKAAARADRQRAEGSPEGVRRRAAHRRSSKTPARSAWKTWWPWKTWRSR